MRKPEIHFPTLLGILVAIVGLVSGVVLLRNPLSALVSASPEEAPQKTQITNITDTEFVVSWVTSKAVAGFVQYGEQNNPSLVVSDDRDQDNGNVGSYFTHFVTVKGLNPSTNYVFKIGSGKNLYDQQGQLYTVSTGPQLKDSPTADVAYGQVMTGNGDPAEGAIVYLHLSGVVPQAALVKTSGSWVIPLATSRTTDLTSFAPYDPSQEKLEIFVEGGTLGTTQTQITTAEDKPVANLTITSGDVAQAEEVNSTPTPTTDPDLPSKFTGDAVAIATPSAALVILTPQLDEQINSTKPQILGKAPANAKIQIEIHSDQIINGSALTDKNGNWTYSVPSNLAPGQHTITISTLVNGVTKQVTRSFVVEAAGESNAPAISASPSATLIPTIPVTVTVTPRPTPTPTIIPRVAYPSTESGVPATGNLTPTLMLAILGLTLLGAGLVSYKFIRT